MSVDKTIEWVAGFQAGSADREGKIVALQEQVDRLNKHFEDQRNWLLGARFALTKACDALP